LAAGSAQASGTAAARADFQGQRASAEARKVAHWALASRNAQGKPFAIVDKKDARVFVFGADGRLQGAAPALLGLAVGDDSAPGVGQRVAIGIAPDERTTPAGRFDSQPGHNLNAEAIVWVDYKAAVAPPAPGAAERRAQRLASSAADDRRISLGCRRRGGYDEWRHVGRRHGVFVLPNAPWALCLARASTPPKCSQGGVAPPIRRCASGAPAAPRRPR
jgi:hypothetical protein